MRGVHVLNDTVHDLDAAVRALQSLGTCGVSVATLYCFSRCDFSPAFYRMGHDVFWRPIKKFVCSLEALCYVRVYAK